MVYSTNCVYLLVHYIHGLKLSIRPYVSSNVGPRVLSCQISGNLCSAQKVVNAPTQRNNNAIADYLRLQAWPGRNTA